MSNSYYTEVVVSYEKTINNMNDFKNHLKAQTLILEKLEKQIKKDSMRGMIEDYNELTKKLSYATKVAKEFERVQGKLKSTNEKNAQVTEKLKAKYIAGYAAIKKYNESVRELTALNKKEKLSKEEMSNAMKLLRRERALGNLEMSKTEKGMNALKAKHIEGAAASQLYTQKEKELNLLLNFGNISIAERNKKLQEYKDQLNSATTKIGKMAAEEKKATAARAGASAEMKNLINKYDQSTDAAKRRTKAIKDLNTLVKKGILTDQRALELLRRFTLANNEATQSIKKLNAAMHAWQSVVKTLHVLWKVFFAVMAAQTLTRWITDFAKAGENIELMGRKLKIFTGEAESLQQVSEVAIRVGIDFDTLNKTMTRFALTTRGAFSVEEMLSWTEALVKAGRITGTTTQELKSGLLQLSQAMSAGRLMGDEYRSISENMPMLKQALEDVFESMGRGNEDLKTLSRNGEITTEILIDAFGRLDQTVAGMGDAWDTIDSALQRVVIQWQLLVYQMTEGNSLFKNMVNGLADILEYVREGVFGELSQQQKEAITSGEKLVDQNEKIASSFGPIVEETGAFQIVMKGLHSLLIDDAVAESTLEFEKLNNSLENASESAENAGKSAKELGYDFSKVYSEVKKSTIEVEAFGTILKGALGTVALIATAKLISHFALLKLGFTATTTAATVFTNAMAYMNGILIVTVLRLATLLASLKLLAVKLWGIVAASGPIGWVTIAIAALVGGVVHYYNKLKEADAYSKEYNATLQESATKMDEYKASIEETSRALESFSGTQLDATIVANRASIVELTKNLTPVRDELNELRKTGEKSFFLNPFDTEDEKRIVELEHKLSQITSAMGVYTDNINMADAAKEKLGETTEKLQAALQNLSVSKNTKAFDDYNKAIKENSEAYGKLVSSAIADNRSQLYLDQQRALYLQNITDATNTYAATVNKSNDAMKDSIALAKEKAAAEKELLSLFKQANPDLSKLIAKMTTYDKQLQANMISEERFKELRKDATAEYLAAIDPLKSFTEQLEKLRNEYADGPSKIETYNNSMALLIQGYNLGKIGIEEFRMIHGKLKDQLEGTADAQKEFASLFDQANPELTTYIANVSKYHRQLELNIISEEEWKRLLKEAKDAYAYAIDPLREYKDKLKELTDKYAEAPTKIEVYTNAMSILIKGYTIGAIKLDEFLKIHSKLREELEATGKATGSLSAEEKLAKRIKEEYNSGTDKEVVLLQEAKKLLDKKKISQKEYNSFYAIHIKLTKNYIKGEKEANELAKERLAIFKKTNPLLSKYVEDLKEIDKWVSIGAISEQKAIDLRKEKLDLYKVSVICESTIKELNCLEEMRAKYDEVYAAQDAYARGKDELDRTFANTNMSLATYNAELKKLDQTLIEAAASAGDLGAKFTLMWQDFSKGVDENVKGLFSDVLKGEEDAWDNFTDRIKNSFFDMLADMAYELLKSSVWKFLSGDFSGGLFDGLIGGFTSLISKGVDALTGGAASSTVSGISSAIGIGGATVGTGALLSKSLLASWEGAGIAVSDFGTAATGFMKEGASMFESLNNASDIVPGAVHSFMPATDFSKIATDSSYSISNAYMETINTETPTIVEFLASKYKSITSGIGDILSGDFTFFEKAITGAGDVIVSAWDYAVKGFDVVVDIGSTMLAEGVAAYTALKEGAQLLAVDMLQQVMATELAKQLVLQVIPVIGWIYTAYSIIDAFFGGSKKDPPEMNFTSSSSKYQDRDKSFQYSDNDYSEGFDSTFGYTYSSSKHDAFRHDKEGATAYAEAFKERITTLDEMISLFIGGDETDRVVKALEGYKIHLEDYRDIGGAMDTFMLARYDMISDAVGGAFAEGFDIAVDIIRATASNDGSIDRRSYMKDVDTDAEFFSVDQQGITEQAVIAAMTFSTSTEKLQDLYKQIATGNVTEVTTTKILTSVQARELNNLSKGTGLNDLNEYAYSPGRPRVQYEGEEYTSTRVFKDAIPNIEDFITIMNFFNNSSEEAANGLEDLMSRTNEWRDSIFGLEERTVKEMGVSRDYDENFDYNNEQEALVSVTKELSKSVSDIVLDFIELDQALFALGIQTQTFSVDAVLAYKELVDWAGSIDGVIEKIGTLYSVNTALDSMSIAAFDMSIAGIKASNAFVDVYEGFEEGKTAFESMSGALLSFFDKFGTEEEKFKFISEQYVTSITAINDQFGTGFSLLASDYKQTILDMLGDSDIPAEAKKMMLSVDGLALSVVQATPTIEQFDESLGTLLGTAHQVNTMLLLTGQSLYDFSEQGVALAESLVEAAGGMDSFTSKMQYYYDNFFTEEEKIATALEGISDPVDAFNEKFGELGEITLGSNESLKEFINGLDSTTEAGIAAKAAALDFAPTMIESTNLLVSTAQIYNDAMGNIQNNTIDALAEIEQTFADTMTQLTEDVLNARAAISANADSSIENWTLQTLNDEEKYNYFDAQANELYRQLQGSTDVTEIESLSASILSLGDAMFGLLDDTSKDTLLAEFIESANTLESTALSQINSAQQIATWDALLEQSRGAIEVDVAEQEAISMIHLDSAMGNAKAAAEAMVIAAEAMQKAANTSLTAAKTEKEISVTVETTSEVG